MEEYSISIAKKHKKRRKKALEELCLLVDLLVLFRGAKNEMRYSQQAESSAIRVPEVSRSFLQDGNESLYTLKLPDLYPDD